MKKIINVLVNWNVESSEQLVDNLLDVKNDVDRILAGEDVIPSVEGVDYELIEEDE